MNFVERGSIFIIGNHVLLNTRIKIELSPANLLASHHKTLYQKQETFQITTQEQIVKQRHIKFIPLPINGSL